MKASTRTIAVVVPAILFGGIALSAALDMWQTSPKKEPVKFATGEFAGQANPADIRGSYFFEDVEKAFGVPAAVLAKAFGMAGDRDPAAFQVKELEGLFAGKLPEGQEIGADSVRMFVALYRGLPYTPEGNTVLPPAAAASLRQLGTLKPEQVVWVEGHTAGGSPAAPVAAQGAAEPAAAVPQPSTISAESAEDRAIKGKTTFGELMQWGLRGDEIERVIGMPMGAPGSSVRDHLSQKGLEFTAYKTELQELVDRLRR